MAKKRKSNYLTMEVYHHGIWWWLFIGWWWRPILYIFWIMLSCLTGFGLKRTSYRKKKGA